MESMTSMSSKEFLRFRKEDLKFIHLIFKITRQSCSEQQVNYVWGRSVLGGLYELDAGAKETIVAEIFGCHPIRALNYFIEHIYDTHHHLVTSNLQWWDNHGLMERSAIAIEEKLGARFDKICWFHRL